MYVRMGVLVFRLSRRTTRGNLQTIMSVNWGTSFVKI